MIEKLPIITVDGKRIGKIKADDTGIYQVVAYYLGEKKEEVYTDNKTDAIKLARHWFNVVGYTKVVALNTRTGRDIYNRKR